MMYLDKLQVGSKLSPRVGGTVGFGVLLSFPTEEKSFYTVLTDFGNQIYLSEIEICNCYTNEVYYEHDYLSQELLEHFAVDNLEERLTQQIKNLQKVLDGLYQQPEQFQVNNMYEKVLEKVKNLVV